MEYQNNSTSELELCRWEIWYRLFPVICIMAVLGTLGVAGNVVVIIFYTTKCKRNSTATLILFLAVMDTFVCILIIPNIVEMTVNVTDDRRVICKMVHAVGIGFVGSSVFSLMLIAIDRHRKICLPFKAQLTQTIVKYAIIGTLIFFFCLGIRNLFTFDIIRVELKSGSGEIFHGTYCTASDLPQYKKIILIINSVGVFIIIMVWITIITCYSLIAIRLAKLRKKRKQNEQLYAKQKEGTVNADKKPQVSRLQDLAETDDSSTDVSCTDTKFRETPLHNLAETDDYSTDVNCTNTYTRETDFEFVRTKDSVNLKSAKQKKSDSAPLEANLDKNTLKLCIQVTKEPFSMSETVENEDETEQQQPKPKKRSKRYSKRRPKKTSGISSMELRLTFMMLTVSVVFILCFLPYFAIRIVARNVLKTGVGFELEPLKQIALRLPYLNSVFHPFIYLFFNREFRAFVWAPIGFCISKLRHVTMHF